MIATIHRKCGHRETWEYEPMALIHNLIAAAKEHDCFECQERARLAQKQNEKLF